MAKSTITVGLVTVPVTLSPAVDDDSGEFKVVHTHEGGDPAKVTVKAVCTACEDTRSSVFAFPDRGHEVDGKMVVVSKEDIAEAGGAPLTNMVPAFHHRDEVYGATIAADSVQNVFPQKGFEKQYVALRNSLAAHPDIVAVTVWSPRSKNALWVLEVVGDRIVASKRSWPEDVRAVAATPVVDVPDVEQAFFDTLVTGMVSDFKVETYVDERRQGVGTLIASRMGDAVAIPAGAVPTATGGTDLLAALQASVDALKPKKPVKKAAAKRTARKVA